MVPCAGCGEPTPYEVGEGASHGEHHSAALGLCFVRTHRDRECVRLARERNGVKRATVLGPSREERAREKLG